MHVFINKLGVKQIYIYIYLKDKGIKFYFQYKSITFKNVQNRALK